MRREIEQELADLERTVGTLQLSVVPEDAAVLIDGNPPEARDGATILLPVGSHGLELRAPGRRSATRSLEIVAGATASISVQLEIEPPLPEPAPAPPPAAAAASAAPPVVSQPSLQTVDRSLVHPRRPSVAGGPGPTAGPSGPPRFLRWGALGVATATGIAAGVLGSLALDANERFDEAATRIEDGEVDDAKEEELRRQARQDADRANDLALWTDVMLGVTAAAAVGTLVLFLTAPSDPAGAEENPGTQVEVSGLAGGAGIRVTGNF